MNKEPLNRVKEFYCIAEYHQWQELLKVARSLDVDITRVTPRTTHVIVYNCDDEIHWTFTWEEDVQCISSKIPVSFNEYINKLKGISELQPRKVTELNEFEAIHCPTLDDAHKICGIMHNADFKWCSGMSYLERNHWCDRQENTCYIPKRGTYGSLEYCTENGFKIYSASDFITDEWTPKAGELVEVSDFGIDWVIREFIATSRNQFITWSEDFYRPVHWNLCRPIKPTITKEEAEKQLNCRIITEPLNKQVKYNEIELAEIVNEYRGTNINAETFAKKIIHYLINNKNN